MAKKIVTIGTLLDVGLIKKSTKVKFVTTKDLKTLHLIKSIPKEKLKKITIGKLMKRGLIKKK